MENGLKDSTLTRPKVSPAVEEAVKRNTDCVYFLASPLTCKKGIDCEYRHSEAVRVNPRDCYYWLTNTCLNPKCAFRHPPLDVGTPKTPTTPALPTESPSTSQIPPAHPSTTPNSSKQRIPCFYFKKGMCLKGDNCFFMHGPLPVINPISQKIPDAARAVTVNTQTFKMPSWSLNNSASQQNSPNTVSVQSPTAVASAAKSVKKAENFSAMSFPVKNNLVPKQLDIKIPPKSHNENKSAASNTFYRRPFANNIHKGREPEKSVDKYSPVLNAQNHYTSDDDEGRNHSTNVDRSSDHTTTAFRRDSHTQGHDHGLEISPERRKPPKIKSLIEMDGSDLRHQLLKHRRLNVSSSSASSDHRRKHSEEQEYQYRKHSNDHHEVSVGKRLQGRITLPVRPAPDSFVDSTLLGRDLERERNMARSPGKPVISNRLGQRVTEFLSAGTGNNGLLLYQNLKELKVYEDLEMRHARSNNDMRLGDGICSFEGPKSLSEILERKRKRGVASGNGEISNYNEESGDKNIDSSIVQTNFLECDEKHQTLNNIKEAESDVAGDGKKLISSEVEDHVQLQACTNNEDFLEMEDSTLVENLEDVEYENYDQEDEYEYEENEGEENGYDLEDENGDGDDTEFGTKVMFSESAS